MWCPCGKDLDDHLKDWVPHRDRKRVDAWWILCDGAARMSALVHYHVPIPHSISSPSNVYQKTILHIAAIYESVPMIQVL